MKQEFIIDGYNLIHKDKYLHSLLSSIPNGAETARKELLLWISKRFCNKRVVIKIVFDGRYPGLSTQSSYSQVNAIYSIKPQTADDVIISYVRNHRKPTTIIVVTGDRKIIENTAEYGVTILSPEEFLNILRPSNSTKDVTKEESIKYSNINAEEVDAWAEYLDINAEEDIHLE